MIEEKTDTYVSIRTVTSRRISYYLDQSTENIVRSWYPEREQICFLTRKSEMLLLVGMLSTLRNRGHRQASKYQICNNLISIAIPHQLKKNHCPVDKKGHKKREKNVVIIQDRTFGIQFQDIKTAKSSLWFVLILYLVIAYEQTQIRTLVCIYRESSSSVTIYQKKIIEEIQSLNILSFILVRSYSNPFFKSLLFVPQLTSFYKKKYGS